jgi:hypothetical protein
MQMPTCSQPRQQWHVSLALSRLSMGKTTLAEVRHVLDASAGMCAPIGLTAHKLYLPVPGSTIDNVLSLVKMLLHESNEQALPAPLADVPRRAHVCHV